MHRPMLACPLELDRLRFPAWGSPKLDGIRATHQLATLRSRTLNVLPNRRMQREYGNVVFADFDGEMIYDDPTHPNAYQRTYSVVMSPTPDLPVDYYLFDLLNQGSASFEQRYDVLQRRAELAQTVMPGRVHLVEQRVLRNVDDVLAYDSECLDLGYEGLILRDPTKPYIHSRGSMVGQHLMKLKHWEDSEAVIIGFEELQRNLNPAELDERGLTKRSTRKENKVPGGMLGKFIVRDLKTNLEFGLSGRISRQQRVEWWAIREQLIGRIVTYKHFAITGVRIKPRQPIFKWFRDPMDFD